MRVQRVWNSAEEKQADSQQAVESGQERRWGARLGGTAHRWSVTENDVGRPAHHRFVGGRNGETVGRKCELDDIRGMNRQKRVKVPDSAPFVIGTDDRRTGRSTVAMLAAVMAAKMSVNDPRATVVLVIVAVEV